MIRRALLLIAVLALSACATDKPLSFQCTRLAEFSRIVPETPGAAPESGQVGIASEGGALSPLAQDLAASFGGVRAAATPGSGPSVLVLSGGGQWGAFGAGYLRRWSKGPIGGEARPAAFDVVTGVSTGSLQATYAFLGASQDDALVDAYAISSERQLVRRHGSLFFLGHASMADNAPLRSYVSARLAPLLDQVAAADPARKLYVGIVDGLSGRMRAVDLTRIARELKGVERLDCYVGALLASSAVPVVFRQVRIGGTPYLDGGVRQSVFVTGIAGAANAALASQGRTGTIYVLMNGDVDPSSVDDLPPKLLPTVGRLRSIVFNQIELASIFGVARASPAMRTMVTTAAGHDCQAKPDEEEEVFSPRVMACLRAFAEGEHQAQPEPWRLFSTS
jgi:predicted acylesterase/phospholipase RssA